jgi:hypothetical protein
MYNDAQAQFYTFDFANNGKRVCLASSVADTNNETIKILLFDSAQNTSKQTFIARRIYGTIGWVPVASNLPAGTGHWIDNNCSKGNIYEYQIKRLNSWNYNGINYDAIGYTIGSLVYDNTGYKGRVMLLTNTNIVNNMPSKYMKLKREITADGWLVDELITGNPTDWNCDTNLYYIKNAIKSKYNNAPLNDKHKILFILGHVMLPRSGSTTVTAPDEHDENKGARGCDAFYADIDGNYTDTATFNPGGLASTLAVNLPWDSKFDQDFFPSEIEMAFGRVDFADVSEISGTEIEKTSDYLDRLSAYKNVSAGYDMGDKSAFYFGYDNSNDGSYRSLLNICKPSNVYQNYIGQSHNEWVKNNGPFKVYMQNLSVPEISDWQLDGMNATVFTSDQSYWGFGDVPQPDGIYSRIRSLLAVNTKCLVTLWTTTGINIFHQACNGQPLGLAMKQIMNHNTTNQYLQKPPQDYDTENWWNRTHFAFYGDPTLNLYQIAPPQNVSLSEQTQDMYISWQKSADTNVLGYHVYESDSLLGKFEKITTSIVTDTTFKLTNYVYGRYYMVKAIKAIESGCGIFMHSSLGKSVLANTKLNTIDQKKLPLFVFPNPTFDKLYLSKEINIVSYTIRDHIGKTIIVGKPMAINESIDVSKLNSGMYNLELSTKTQRFTYKFIKQ